MTNKEFSRWLKEKPTREWKYKDGASVYCYCYYGYEEKLANEEVGNDIVIREDDGEWREPLVEEYASDLELIYKKGVLDGYNKANEQLIKAKELIEELSSSLSVVGECEEEECELLNRAEQFLSEVEK